MFGLIPFMMPAYAIMIATGIFFGIKIFTHRRQKFLEKTIGEGYCAECGEKIIDKKCPNCDKTKES
jgi:prolipoprotein diacylglyceryltransferase